MTLEEKAAEAAANAICTRCGGSMMRKRLTNQLTTGTYRRVGVKGTEHFSLCSDCGPAFRLFLAGSVVLA